MTGVQTCALPIYLDLKYKVVDGDGDTIGGSGSSANIKFTITVVNDNLYSFAPTNNDDTLLYNGSAASCGNMMDGNDSLLFASGGSVNLDCSAPPGVISNVEIFDLSVTGINQITNLTAAYVDSITDYRNTLYILGTSEDKVLFDNTLTASGSSTQTVNGHDYVMTRYTGTNATVYIENSISVTP